MYGRAKSQTSLYKLITMTDRRTEKVAYRGTSFCSAQKFCSKKSWMISFCARKNFLVQSTSTNVAMTYVTGTTAKNQTVFTNITLEFGWIWKPNVQSNSNFPKFNGFIEKRSLKWKPLPPNPSHGLSTTVSITSCSLYCQPQPHLASSHTGTHTYIHKYTHRYTGTHLDIQVHPHRYTGTPT